MIAVSQLPGAWSHVCLSFFHINQGLRGPATGHAIRGSYTYTMLATWVFLLLYDSRSSMEVEQSDTIIA